MPYLTVEELYRTRLEAFLSQHAPALEEKVKHRELLEEAFRDSCGQIDFHFEGSLIRIGRLPGWAPYERKFESKCGRIGGFTVKARGRLMNICARIRRDASALFVTLTNPDTWDADPTRWKRDLDAFGKWLRRDFSGCSAIWKLEPQQRGAPHFHLFVWGIAFLHHQKLAQRWFEIVGSNDPRHRAAGTRVEAVRSRNGGMRYASKLYMGKDFEMPPGWEHVGRFWGIIGRADLPLSACEPFVEPVEVMIRFRRIVRRFLRSKGFTRRSRAAMRLFTEQHFQWARVLDWASGNLLPSLDEVLAATAAKRSAEHVPPKHAEV